MNQPHERPAAAFPQFLLDAGWEQVEKVLFSASFKVPFWRPITIALTEPRFLSPYTGKYHKLHKALRKEVQMQEITQQLFI